MTGLAAFAEAATISGAFACERCSAVRMPNAHTATALSTHKLLRTIFFVTDFISPPPDFRFDTDVCIAAEKYVSVILTAQ